LRRSPAEANLIFWSVTQEQEMPDTSTFLDRGPILADALEGYGRVHRELRRGRSRIARDRMESNMKAPVKIIASRIADLMRQIGAQFDPEVLQWPGGSVIALLLLFRTTVTAAFDSRRFSDF
jgi:hypothetical protein